MGIFKLNTPFRFFGFLLISCFCSTMIWAQQPSSASSPTDPNTPPPATPSSEQQENTGTTQDLSKGVEAVGEETETLETEEDLESLKRKSEAKAGSSPGLINFGHNLFNNPNSNFAPNVNRPIPLNYTLGPGDQLLIDITGNSVVAWNVTVMPDGAVNIPGIGRLYVSGRTIENATEAIKSMLKAHNFAIDNGSQLSVIVTNIRTIKVTISGQVSRPGTYQLSSLTTVFNALYESGGISKDGSIRAVELIRNNKLMARIDAYNYLLYGDLSENFQLRDDDVIRVPEYRVRISITGEIKRPAYYDILPGETLRDVIIFSGGLTDLAYVNDIKAIQISDKQYRVKDIRKEELEDYIPLKGDRYTIGKILDRFENRLTIQGAVFRPGAFELSEGLTLRELILTKAEGLKEDAYLERGYINRLNPDNSSQTISFYLKAIVDGTDEDILLQREDVVTIPSIFDIAESFNVSIRGQVRNPTQMPFFQGMTVEDLILRSGGFAVGANMYQVQVARRITDSDLRSPNAKLSDIFTINVDPQLKLSESKFQLEPFDIVTVHALPGYVSPQIVQVEGEVMKPGFHAMARKDEKISDFIKRVEGFTAYAYVRGASLTRTTTAETKTDAFMEQLRLQQFKELQADATDKVVSIDLGSATVRSNTIGIDLEYILKNPGSPQDLILMDGDILNIPRELQTVRISGEVNTPITVVYEKRKNLRDYVMESGGFTERALRRKSFVFYANGGSKGTKNPLYIFRNYPTIEPGAEIFIPRKQPKNFNLTPQSIASFTGGLSSITALVLTFIAINNNK